MGIVEGFVGSTVVIYTKMVGAPLGGDGLRHHLQAIARSLPQLKHDDQNTPANR
ncbi:MAG: hypothetical protein F6K31_29210 [Symploca sp. SIO2G7]|nr:hypothetical protein [Symploca sp. SIO2G7]